MIAKGHSTLSRRRLQMRLCEKADWNRMLKCDERPNGVASKTKKLLIVAHDSGLRGAERVVADEARELLLQGWDVLVVVPARSGGLYDYLGENGIPRISISYFSWMGPGHFKGRARRTIGNLLALPRMVILFRNHSPDIIHVHSIACGVGAIASRLVGVPHIWHIHEPGPYATSSDRPLFDLGEDVSLALARWCKSRFVAVSQSVARVFENKLQLDGVGVLYQPIRLNTEVDLADAAQMEIIATWKGRKLIIVGALIAWKDQMTAVRAMTEIVEQWPDTALFLVGPDPVGLGTEIDELARKLGISENVIRVGAMVNAHPAINIADACIVTAVDEGFGRVQVEAMLAETPVIVADVSVNREVADEDNVDFFAPTDPKALAKTVITLFTRSRVEQLFRQDQAMAYAQRRFSPEATDKALETELLTVINNAC